MSSIPGYQRIPSLEALALQAYISAESSQPESMEIEKELPPNYVSDFARSYWERLRERAPHGPLGIRNAMRTIEQEARKAEQSASETSSANGTLAPLSTSPSRLPEHCKVTELFRQLAERLNEELQKSGRSLQAEVPVAPEQFKVVQAGLQREAEQWTLKLLCNRVRRSQGQPAATDQDFQNWLANLANEAPALNIHELSLAHPAIQALPNEIRHFQGLETLALRSNDFYFPPPVLNLRYLPESIHNLTNLTWLIVKYCELEELPQSFHLLVNLQELGLTSNHLESLPESFGQLTRLRRLELDQNLLEHLPPSFGNLTHLEELNLSKNPFKHLPESLGNLVQLRRLYLEDLHLTAAPKWLKHLPNLETLSLSHNSLRQLKKSFGNLTNLVELNLQHNQLEELPESFGNLTNLAMLYLQNNQLQKLPESFGNLDNLTDLYASSNNLRELPPTFGQLAFLAVILFDSNEFCKFPSLIFNLGGPFEILDFEHNYITMLPEELKGLEVREEFRFIGNPLLLISDTQLNTTTELSELVDLQFENLSTYKPLTYLSSLFLALARENLPEAQDLFNQIDPLLRDQILSEYQDLAALETQELNPSSSSSSTSSSSSSQPDASIYPFTYPHLLSQALRQHIYDAFEELSQPDKEAVISKVLQLEEEQNVPQEKRLPKAAYNAKNIDGNLLRWVDAMELNALDRMKLNAPDNLELNAHDRWIDDTELDDAFNEWVDGIWVDDTKLDAQDQDRKRKAASPNPSAEASAPPETKRLKKQDDIQEI